MPGEQPKKPFIKLNTNENPYPPSLKVKALLAQFPIESLRLYPDPSASFPKEAIAEYYAVRVDELFLGNGSDEILAFAFQAFFDEERPVAFPDVTYSFYPVYADFFSIPAQIIPLREDFSLPLEELKKFRGGLVIANPNAPTGVAIGLDEIRGLLLSDRDRLIVLDEAYIDFGGESAVRLIDEFDNLLVVQTVSKSRSLAGLRVGYAMGCPSLIQALERVRDSINSYTVDTLAQKLTRIAMEDGPWFEQTRAWIIETREWFVKELDRLGFKTLPSKANFIFTTHPDFGAGGLYELLREQGILVRYFNKPRIDNHLRISIGTDEEMKRLVRVLESLIK